MSDDADAYLSPGGIPPLRVARVTARVLLGEALPPDELLKTSGSKLEVILREEGAAMDVLDTPSAKQKPTGQRRRPMMTLWRTSSRRRRPRPSRGRRRRRRTTK